MNLLSGSTFHIYSYEIVRILELMVSYNIENAIFASIHSNEMMENRDIQKWHRYIELSVFECNIHVNTNEQQGNYIKKKQLHYFTMNILRANSVKVSHSHSSSNLLCLNCKTEN